MVNIQSKTLGMTRAIKGHKQRLGLKKNQGFQSSFYEIVRNLDIKRLKEDKEYFDQKAEDIKKEYMKNSGYDEYYFYQSIREGMKLSGEAAIYLGVLQVKAELPKCQLFITNGMDPNDVGDIIKELEKVTGENQEVVLTLDMGLGKYFFRRISENFQDYQHTYIRRSIKEENWPNYNYIRRRKNDERNRHITNVIWQTWREDKLPAFLLLKILGFDTMTYIQQGGGNNEEENTHPYKIKKPPKLVTALDAFSGAVMRLKNHQDVSCDCSFHRGKTVLHRDILDSLSESTKGKSWIAMHNIEKLAELLEKPASELIKKPAIQDRKEELGIIL